MVWEERYRGSASDEGQHLVALRRPPALYLLTDHVGVAFEDDGLRDGEHLRHWMTERFEQVLAAQPAPWLKVTGSHSQRLTQATAAIDQVLADGWHFAAPLG
jgi:nicotinamide riboside kinase